MLLDARTDLFDILNAIADIREFTRDQTFESYSQSRLLVSAVERQLSIIREAIPQLLRLEPAVSKKICRCQRPKLKRF